MVKSWETEEKLQNVSNEKKVKKVIKGLEKASKTHAKQAKILKSGLKVIKARGGKDASKQFRFTIWRISGGWPCWWASMGGKSKEIQVPQEQVVVIKILHLKLQVQRFTTKKRPFKSNIGLTAWLLMQFPKAFMMQKNLKNKKKWMFWAGDACQGKETESKTLELVIMRKQSTCNSKTYVNVQHQKFLYLFKK